MLLEGCPINGWQSIILILHVNEENIPKKSKISAVGMFFVLKANI